MTYIHLMSSISHGSLTFLKKNLTTVILAVRSAQLENSRSGAYSQIPQSSKLEFPFPSRADFPSPTIWFCVLRGVLMYPVWSLAVHLPPISVSSFTAPWTASTSHFFPHRCPFPPLTPLLFSSCLITPIGKKTVTESKCHCQWWPLQETITEGELITQQWKDMVLKGILHSC